MNVSDKYYHIHNKNLTCAVLALTNKGAKVLMFAGRKNPKIGFFNTDVFFPSKNYFWNKE
jgi:hypothetical protein